MFHIGRNNLKESTLGRPIYSTNAVIMAWFLSSMAFKLETVQFVGALPVTGVDILHYS